MRLWLWNRETHAQGGGCCLSNERPSTTLRGEKRGRRRVTSEESGARHMQSRLGVQPNGQPHPFPAWPPWGPLSQPREGSHPMPALSGPLGSQRSFCPRARLPCAPGKADEGALRLFPSLFHPHHLQTRPGPGPTGNDSQEHGMGHRLPRPRGIPRLYGTAGRTI